MEYPVKLARDDNNTLRVRFPDFPEAITHGNDSTDALERAKDALATVIDAYIKDRRPIPTPSVPPRAYYVRVPALTEAKIRLYEVMREGKIGKAELARRLKVHMPQVDRLVDVHHGSRLDQLEGAFKVLGKRLVVRIEDEAEPPRRAVTRAVVRRRVS